MGKGQATQVEEIRQFNRFYTAQLGLLDEGHLQSPFSLTEVRILYELAQRQPCAASTLRTVLKVDAGYMSRLLSSFESRRLIRRRQAAQDKRMALLELTAKGKNVFDSLDAQSSAHVRSLLSPLSPPEQNRVVDGMREIQRLLGGSAPVAEPYVLRPPKAGDLGWVVQSHGALYAQEYGWDERFEALVAQIVAEFVHQFDVRRTRCWIAERGGKNVGSVFLMRKSASVAQLRLLLVDPSARGLGIGARLVEECIQFAKQSRYKRLVLWTNSVLRSARRIYEHAGFVLTSEERHTKFGPELVGQLWERGL